MSANLVQLLLIYKYIYVQGQNITGIIVLHFWNIDKRNPLNYFFKIELFRKNVGKH